MSLLTVPNVFVNGNLPTNVIDAVQMNANFTAVQTAVNNIYPSQVLPLTALQATFGATATGVGYKFLANDATATPLTASGIAGQSADIFDVTLTSGGTKALTVSSGGIVQSLNGTQSSLSALSGFLQVGGLPAQLTGQYLTADFQGIQAHSGTSAGTLNLNSLGGTTSAGGAMSATSFVLSGSPAATGNILDDGTNLFFRMYQTSGSFFFQTAGGTSIGNINGSTGVYTATSDTRLKENAVPISLGLTDLMLLNPVEFAWTSDKTQGQGFIAQEIQKIIPKAVSVVDLESGILGISDAMITPVIVKALQEFYAEFKAWALAHP